MPPDDGPDGNGPPPAPERQSNLTDPDSALMRKSARHEYRQAYNAQAVVDAEGSQLIVATGMAITPGDQPTFAATILAMEAGIGLPRTVLADAGFAGRAPVEALKARASSPWWRSKRCRGAPLRLPATAGRTQARPCDQGTLETGDAGHDEHRTAKALYRLRKQTVEPVFGIVKAAMGFRQFLMRGWRRSKLNGPWWRSPTTPSGWPRSAPHDATPRPPAQIVSAKPKHSTPLNPTGC